MNLSSFTAALGNLKKQRLQASSDISKLRDAAKAIRERIAALNQERAEIMATPVEKADFIEAVLNSVDSVGKLYPQKLASYLTPRVMDHAESSVRKIIPGKDCEVLAKNLLTCNPLIPVDITADALFFVFADEIKRGVKKAMEDGMAWNHPKTIKLEEARKKIAAIDTELEELKERLAHFIETAKSFNEEI